MTPCGVRLLAESSERMTEDVGATHSLRELVVARGARGQGGGRRDCGA